MKSRAMESRAMISRAMKALAWDSPALRILLWAILSTGSLLCMESIAFSLWYHALFKSAQASWTGILFTVFAVLSASLLILQAMQRYYWNRAARQIVFFAWLVLAAFASLKLLLYLHDPIRWQELIRLSVEYILRADVNGKNFYHVIVIGLLAWRGVSMAHRPVNISDVQASFQFWLITLLLYGMMFAPLYPAQATLGLYLFLFFGLVAMSAARVVSLGQSRGGRVPRFGMGWTASIILSALALVGLSILISWLAGGRVVQVLASLLVLVFALLTALVLLLLSPLLMYLADILPQLASLIQQLLDRFRNLPYSQQIQRLLQAINEGLVKAIPYLLATRSVFMFAFLGLLIVVILLALYMRGRHMRPVLEEESNWLPPGTVDNPLRRILRRILQGARAFRGRSPAQVLAAARIRQIYRQLMALSKKMGAERPSSITPLEFLPQLNSILPGEDANLRLVTRAYLKVRYGEYPETRQEVETVEAAWKCIHKKSRETLPLRPKKT